jgi:two-component system response regulator HydG
MTARILIVDDEPVLLKSLSRYLEAQGYGVAVAADAASAWLALEGFAMDLVLLDLGLPDRPGLDLLSEIKQSYPGIGVVVLTAHGEVDTIVEAMRAHADHYVLKPARLDVIGSIVSQVLRQHRQNEELDLVRRQERVRGVRPASRDVQLPDAIWHQIELVASSPTASVLLQGETGTGKGVVARLIHDLGSRKDRRLVEVNCAGLSRELLESELFGHERGAFTSATSRKRGLIELAEGGSLLLDEIGDLPLDVQPKLLTVIEERSFRRLGGTESLAADVRIMAATNVNLQKALAQKRFREDLYYRLSVVPIELPPLRQRSADILPLVRRFLAGHSARLGKPTLGISEPAERLLLAYGWPGNIRELRHAIERAVLLSEGDRILPRDLPEALRHRSHRSAVSLQSDNRLETVERNHLTAVLRAVAGNRTRAAAILGIHRSTLLEKIKRYGIDPA